MAAVVYIKRITVQGFKSFPPKRQVIDLPKGMVVVAGPNGSGKSNILDAIKFAFGELSPHALRVSRFSELIHQSPEGGSTPMARVTVVLDNSDRAIPVDEDEVSITRKLFPNGESQYLIGNRSVSRADLLSLLATANVRPSGFNIVSQGAVLGIAEMGPDDLRQLIEDVAGTGEYDRRREEAMRELEKAERNVAVAKAAASEVRKRIKQLEVEWFDLSRRRFIEAELEALRREEIAAELRRIDAELSRIRSEKSELDEKAGELRRRLAETDAEVAELERLGEQLRSRSSELEAREAALSVSLDDSRKGLSRLQAEIRDRGRRYAETWRRMRGVVESFRSSQEHLSMLMRRLEEVDASAANVGRELGEVEAELNDVAVRIKELEAVVREWERKASSSSSEREALQRRLSAVERQLTELRGKASSLQARLTSIDEEVSRLDAVRTELRTRIEELSSKKEATVSEIGKLRAEVVDLERRLEGSRKAARSAGELKASVETEVKAIESSLTSSVTGALQRALLEVLSVRSIGTLRDLFTPPEGLEPLVLNMLGELLDAIVVRRDADAAAIAVAASSLGIRVKVISVEGWKGCNNRSNGCLACLSRTGSREASAALHIALEEAVLLDDESFPVSRTSVTVSGALRRRGGVFESLGEVVAEGEVRRELEALKTLIPMLEERVASLSAEAEALESRISSLRSVLSEREGNLRSMESEITSLLRERESASRRIDQLSVERQRIVEELARLAEAERRLMAEYEGLQRQIERTVAPLEPTAEREELSRLRERQRELTAKAAELRSELSQLRRERETLVAEVARIERERAEGERYLQESERSRREALEGIRVVAARYAEGFRQLRDLNSELEAVRRELSEVRSQASEVASRLRPLREVRDQLSAELKGLESRLEALRVSEVELTVRRRGLEERLAEMKGGPRSLLASLPDDLRNRIRSAMEAEMGELQLVNQLAPMQYAEVVSGYKQRSERIAELEAERNELLKLIDEIDREKMNVLESTVKRVSESFGEYFRALTGGDAWLEFTDPGNPLESGIEMVVRFPGKAPRSARGVSGGEKSVSAVALILALQSLTPADFLVLDEVDAHLDANYSANLANLLKEMSKKVQIVVVSLKDIVAEKADLLIGVYSRNGASNVVTLKLGELVNEQGKQS
jgi:chromosome segregation protein